MALLPRPRRALRRRRAWLGRASFDTTNICAEIALELKATAIAGGPSPDRPWKATKGLIAFLAAL